MVAVSFACVLLLILQHPPSPPPLRSGVTAVEVDVVVTDTSGQPVRGLRQQDFELGEDGKSVDIANFTAVDVPLAAPSSVPRPIQSGSAFASNEDPDDGRVLLIALDDYHTSLNPGRIARVKAIARRAVERLGPSDRAAVMTLSGRPGGQVDFTNDRALLAAAIDRFAPQLETVLPAIAGPSSDGGSAAAANDRAAELRTIRTMTGLREAVRQLARIPHRRKSILLLSQGFGARLEDIIRDPTVGAASDSAREFMDGAHLNNVSIYTFDPCGLETDRGCNRDTRLNLQIMAERTGGFAMVNSNAQEGGIDRMMAEAGSHYLLAYYSPAPAYDGKYHRVTVHVRRDNVQVRAREGYSSPRKPPQALGREAPADRMIGALLPSRGLTMRVVAIPVPLAIDPAAGVIVGIELLSAAASRAGRVDFTVAAIDEHGKLQARLRFSTNFAPSRSALPEWTRTGSRIDLAPGRYHIRVAAVGRDMSEGSVFTEVEVPAFTGPLEAGGLSVGEAPPNVSTDADRLRGVLPLIPFAKPIVRARVPAEAQLPVRAATKGDGGAVTMTTTLTGEDGVAHEVDRASRPVADFRVAGGGIYRVRLPASLATGQYRLAVEAVHGQTRITRELIFQVVP